MTWRRTCVLLGVVIALGVGVALGHFVLHQTAGRVAEPRQADQWASFQDAQDRLAIVYPGTWRRLSSGNSEVRLLAAGRGGALLLRLAPLPFFARKPGQVARQLGAAALAGQSPATLLGSWPVHVGGLSGYAYSYLFVDRSSAAATTGRSGADDEQGMHLEYLLPRGRQLITIVLQANSVPPPPSLLVIFSRIADSFRSW